MSYHRIKFITSDNRLSQFFCLCHNYTLSSNQRYLVSDTNDQLFFIKRFWNKVIASYLKTFHDICRTIQSCQKDDRNFCRFRISFQLLRNFKATHIRHHHIQQNKIRFLFYHLIQRLTTVTGCRNLKLLISKKHLQQQYIRHYVIYN